MNLIRGYHLFIAVLLAVCIADHAMAQVTVDVRVSKRDTESARRSALVRIERVATDTIWLSSEGALLDAWRSAESETSAMQLRDSIRERLTEEGVNATETVVNSVLRRVRRYPAIADMLRKDIILENHDGTLKLSEKATGIDRIIAGVLLREENLDRSVIADGLSVQLAKP